MALIDLSLVSKALVEILKTRVKELLDDYIVDPSDDWSDSNSKIDVVTVPPNLLDKENGNVIGLYLYHISENSHYKNLPAISNGETPIQYTPMGLDLYYQLTAHSAQQDKIGIYREQTLLGLAVKVLHDYPDINDDTKLVGKKQSVFNTSGLLELADGGNRFRISLHPIAPNEAISYWTAGTSPLRLSAYYQVSVVLLEPEKIQSRVSRVLSYNVPTFVGSGPRLDSSHNLISINNPQQKQPMELELRPAQVSVGDTITFTGTGLTGESIALYINQAGWEKPIKVDGGPTAWNLTQLDENRVTARVQKQAGKQAILPGIYSAAVAVTKSQTSSDISSQGIEVVSNETPFAVTPLIESITPSTTNNKKIIIKSYLFQLIANNIIPEKAVRVYLGSRALTKDTDNNLEEYEYALDNPALPIPPPPNTKDLTLKLPNAMALGDSLPFRIFINGIESPPKWITFTKQN